MAASSAAWHLLSDAEVMLRVAAGDDTAFDYLVEKFRRPLVSFMYRMTHNLGVAEELAQEVFLRVYRSRANYAAEAKFTTWLYRIATNLAVNHARDTKAERSGTSLDEPDPQTGLTLDVADPETTVEQKLLRRERLAAIRKEVESLPERQRLAVDHAQVPKHGLPADRRSAQAERVRHQVAAVPRLRNTEGEAREVSVTGEL